MLMCSRPNLFEAVLVKYFEAIDVQDAYDGVVPVSGALRQSGVDGSVDVTDDPSEEPVVEGLGERVT